jgi:C_GCAxxG_C_C family probable redox protein
MKGETMTAKRREILDLVEERAYANERDYHGCSQSALAALQDVFGMRDEAVFRAASGLGGGIGLSAQTCCGGLSGGCMFISQLCGRQREKDGSFGDKENRRFQAYKYCQLLAERFFHEYNACNCSEIQKKKLDGDSYVLAEPEQFQEFIDRGGHTHICPEVVGKAARWTAEVVLENLEDLGLTDKIQLK